MGEDKKPAYEPQQERPAWVSPHQPLQMSEWYRPLSKQGQQVPQKDVQVDSRAYLRQKIV